MSDEDVRWAIDHNAGVVRAIETKAQIFIGLIIWAAQLCLTAPPPPRVAGLQWVPLGSALGFLLLALILNIRTILPAPRARLGGAGDTPFYVGDASKLEFQTFDSRVAAAGRGDLSRELFKIQRIRTVKSKRGDAANIATLLALIAFGLLVIGAQVARGGLAGEASAAMDQVLQMISGGHGQR